jgi:hypothetical protein
MPGSAELGQSKLPLLGCCGLPVHTAGRIDNKASTLQELGRVSQDALLSDMLVHGGKVGVSHHHASCHQFGIMWNGIYMPCPLMAQILAQPTYQLACPCHITVGPVWLASGGRCAGMSSVTGGVTHTARACGVGAIKAAISGLCWVACTHCKHQQHHTGLSQISMV